MLNICVSTRKMISQYHSRCFMVVGELESGARGRDVYHKAVPPKFRNLRFEAGQRSCEPMTLPASATQASRLERAGQSLWCHGYRHSSLAFPFCMTSAFLHPLQSVLWIKSPQEEAKLSLSHDLRLRIAGTTAARVGRKDWLLYFSY